MQEQQLIQLPQKGTPWPELASRMKSMTGRDLDWRRGRHGVYVWYADAALEHVLSEAYTMFMVENGLNVKAFPSLERMEKEVIGAVLTEFGQPDGAGIMSSGGTESIFLGTYAAREWARKNKPHIRRPNIVAAHSAHPGITKSAYYLGMDVIRVPVRADFRADPEAMAAAVTEDTVMLYASAPAYSVGVIDPIEAIGDVAIKNDLWLHVDACVGGILAPFVRKAGYPVPAFDFTIPGVTSISADLHKSGFTAKGCSLALYRSEELREYARFAFTDWTGAAYGTYTFTGTRPGGAIAAAWAAQQYLGVEGYVDLAKRAMAAKERFVEGLLTMPGFFIHGDPDLWDLCYGSTTLDTVLLQQFLAAAGWRMGNVTPPKGIQMMFTPVHLAVIPDMLEAIRVAAARVAAGEDPSQMPPVDTRYS